MSRRVCLAAAVFALTAFSACRVHAQQTAPLLDLDHSNSQSAFPIVANGRAAAIYIAPGNPETVRVAAQAFADDVEKVTGAKPQILSSLAAPLPPDLIVVGVLGKTPEFDRLRAAHRLVTTSVDGKWEAAETVTILNPPRSVLPGVHNALIVAGADRRGTAYALFALSRAMGVSPWTWWADVPVPHHSAVYVHPGAHIQPSPSVQYRGIFFNDEDWGLWPWASKKMDPTVDNGKGNIGPHTYERVFELLLRLHANSLWPAMHPGSLAFNAVPENAVLADKWGIVMGSSHSEALLRNNVGEWSEKPPPAGDGPWNYQTNAPAMNDYWAKRLQVNGKYENFYTVGLRGVHDSGLEARGSPEVKARLVESVMAEQQKLLAQYVNPDLAKVPQILWLYKESLDLYRIGMKVPPDVTLGWTDDNYGYIRELPTAAEQKRPGGSGLYYHVSYWGAPHDYLWLCTTPPALLREELTKAYDHGVRKYWVLNVGDLKPAELDIDYFMQLATDEPKMAAESQREFLTQWLGEQFPTANAKVLADVMTRYYALSFIRKPEFMGFNGYNDGIKRTEFNPLAWPSDGQSDQNHARAVAWSQLSMEAALLGRHLPPRGASAFFELVGYPVEAAAAMNEKFLAADHTYLDAHNHDDKALAADSARAKAAYDEIQSLTAKYNSLEGGKWDGMMSDHPRDRHVFEMPRLATSADADTPLPAAWSAGDTGCPGVITTATNTPLFFEEQHCTISINAAHFARSSSGNLIARWRVLDDLGISGASVVFGEPGRTTSYLQISTATNSGAPHLAEMWEISPSLDYDFTTTTSGPATLALHLLPTFPIDSDHQLRYAVSLDGAAPIELNAAAQPHAKSPGSGDGPSTADWSTNVLRNSAIANIPLGPLAPGRHTLRLLYRDPGVVFEHLVITFPGAPPAYPVPPETK
ncbi:MAG TPA: glycosyl hydrolase 115 family protein [Acidobacteriaceae bacterium]|nr:glycosyl hydrolase 115 family protein [Acidobacteriaceae bacterium]